MCLDKSNKKTSIITMTNGEIWSCGKNGKPYKLVLRPESNLEWKERTMRLELRKQKVNV